MAQLNFGGTVENVVIRDEFPLEKAREVIEDFSALSDWMDKYQMLIKNRGRT